MGIVDLDLTRWETESGTGRVAKAAKVATETEFEVEQSPQSPQSPSPRVKNENTETPADVVFGLSKLRGMPPPESAGGWSNVWREIVADALWLRGSGLAGQALAMGWEPLHLFGAMPDLANGRSGLAIRLAGCRRVLLYDASAIMVTGDRSRSNYDLRDMGASIFLWDLA